MTDNKPSMGAVFTDGMLWKNPLFRLGLGICPALAVTVTAANALGMGIATACVLVCTSLVASLLGYVVSEKGNAAVFALVSAVFATVAQMILKGWMPSLGAELGIFVPLIAVSTLILGRAGDFAAKHNPAEAVLDAAGMGIGYIVAITLVGIVRELFGQGSVFGLSILPAGYDKMVMMTLPAGGLLVLGLLMGVCNAAMGKRGKEADRDE